MDKQQAIDHIRHGLKTGNRLGQITAGLTSRVSAAPDWAWKFNLSVAVSRSADPGKPGPGGANPHTSGPRQLAGEGSGLAGQYRLHRA
jgi:hypothetical protein